MKKYQPKKANRKLRSQLKKAFAINKMLDESFTYSLYNDK
jgi:hypothetical protein